MKIIYYRDKNKQYRWRVVARNGRKLANGGEGYKNKADRDRAVRSLRRGFANALVLG